MPGVRRCSRITLDPGGADLRSRASGARALLKVSDRLLNGIRPGRLTHSTGSSRRITTSLFPAAAPFVVCAFLSTSASSAGVPERAEAQRRLSAAGWIGARGGLASSCSMAYLRAIVGCGADYLPIAY